jgi:hypothetical protein
MFRPREEKKESVVYKEARKAEEKAKKIIEEKSKADESNEQ